MSEVVTFVHDALAAGKSREETGAALLAAGWRRDEVDAALREFAPVDFSVPVPSPRPRLDARDGFLHLLAFTTLYVSAFGIGTLLFEFINLTVADPLRASYELGTEVYSILRFAVAAVLIALPIFLWVNRTVRRQYREDPERRSAKERRTSTYLTLFLATATVIGYLISLVYRLLGGGLALNFALKVLVVVAIAGATFAYYLPDLRREEEKKGDDVDRETAAGTIQPAQPP